MFEPLHIVAATVAVAVTGRAVSTLRESLQLLFEDRQCCTLLEGKVEMFSQFRSRYYHGLTTILYSNFCALGSSLHCSCWPIIKGMSANRVSEFSIGMVMKLSLCLLGGAFNCIIRLNG